MMNLFNSCFSFFKKTNSLSFKFNLSLYDNFNQICSLPLLKPRSDATKALAEVIKTCQLFSTHNDIYHSTATDEEIYKKVLADIATLQLVKNAIAVWRDWHLLHNKSSERIHLIDLYENNITLMQRNITAYNHGYFMTTHQGKYALWTSPLLNIQNENKLLAQLSAQQIAALKSLKSLNDPTAVHKTKRISFYAIFMPLLNFLDLDFNVIMDSCNLGTEICNLF